MPHSKQLEVSHLGVGAWSPSEPVGGPVGPRFARGRHGDVALETEVGAEAVSAPDQLIKTHVHSGRQVPGMCQNRDNGQEESRVGPTQLVKESVELSNKKQCSRQLQCKVPCGIGNVINSSLFINSSLSSLSFTSHAVQGGGFLPLVGGSCLWQGGSCLQQGEGALVGGGGQGTFQSSCHILHYHMVLRPKGTSHNDKKGAAH